MATQQALKPGVKRSQIRPGTGYGIVAPRGLDAAPAGARGSVNIDDGGGPVIDSIHVHLIFWGSAWNGSPNPSRADITNTVTSMVTGPYLSALAQYRGIRRGLVVDQTSVTTSNPPNGFQDSDVSTMIQGLLNAGTVPEPDQDTRRVYMVFMPPGIGSSGTFTGEHTFFFFNDTDNPADSQRVRFAWVTNNGTLDSVSEITSHEIAEACSDPEGTAFQIQPRNPSSWNEIGDSGCGCQSVDARLNGVLVQKYWSQRDNACVAPDSDIIGLVGKVILGDTSSTDPALASHDERLFLSWKGSGNENLNLMFSEDDGRTFVGKQIFHDTSDTAPALASHNGTLFLGWKGSGNDNLNVARVSLFANSAGGFGIEGLTDKVTLGDTSSTSPALASHQGRLFLAWKGSGNDNLNLMFSEDGGRTFVGKRIFGDTSDSAPALASHQGGLYLAWKGSGNDNLNVARVSFFQDTAGHFGIEGLTEKVILRETSSTGPALVSHDERLFLGWKGSGNDNLNVNISYDRGRSFGEKRIFGDTSDTAPTLSLHAGGLFLGWKGSGNDNLNVARVDMYGSRPALVF
jgi:hypothetical protein